MATDSDPLAAGRAGRVRRMGGTSLQYNAGSGTPSEGLEVHGQETSSGG